MYGGEGREEKSRCGNVHDEMLETHFQDKIAWAGLVLMLVSAWSRHRQRMGWPGARRRCDDEIIPSMQSLGEILVEATGSAILQELSGVSSWENG